MSQPRTRADRRREQRRERHRSTARSVWRGPVPIVGALIAVAAIIAVFVVLSRSREAAAPTGGDAAAVVSSVTSVPRTTFDAVGAGGLPNALHATGVAAPLKGPSGKPVVIYVGAEFCPFCASERWSLIAALSRFGTFAGVALTRSSSSDVYPNTPTFSFTGSTYASDVVELSAVETQDRDKNPIATPTALQSQSANAYDPQGSIPYLSIGDRFYAIGSGYPPDVLAGKSWSEIANALKDPSSPIARAIVGHANYLTAALCAITAQAPAAVCDDAMLKGLAPAK